MNERIKELSKQAQVYADQQWLEAGYPSWESYHEVFSEDYNKKFAELIVRECCGAADEWYQKHNELHWDPAQHIRNHFGVEE
jgi:hypothetical protein